MKFIINIVKGIFIGVANIIPGVSGGTMAVSMGIYDKLINAINDITKKFKESFLYLLPLLIGMIGGIGIFSYIIPYSLSHFAFQTCMCFTGLIVGGIPQIIGNTGKALEKEKKKISVIHILVFLVFLGIAIFMAVANGGKDTGSYIKTDFLTIIILVLMGMVVAAAMVVPGISGSLLLMIFGYYTGIVSTVRDFISSLKAMDTSGIIHALAVIVPFAIGCILGILLISKLISFLFKKFESTTYFAILGLIFSSPFAIFYKMEACTFNAVTIITGIVLLIAATAFTYFFSLKTKNEPVK